MQAASEQAQSPRSTALERALRAAIRGGGPLPFAKFMQRALYDPEFGYYTAGPAPWGVSGDYITTPQVHPAVGQSIARYAIELDEALGRPAPFDLVEHGSGNGALARSVLETIAGEAPDLWARTRFVSVEPGAEGRAAQADLPQPGHGLQVATPETDMSAAWRGLVYSNELLDAFPVHRVRMAGGVLEEAHVDVVDGRLTLCYLAPSTPAINDYLVDNGVALREGQIADICLQVAEWVRTAASRLEAGAVLVIDYGYETQTLFGESRPHGTLVAQQRFALSDDVVSRPGDRDLTAHVDFGNLRRCAQVQGLHWGGLCSLRVFLLGMGASRAAGEPGAADRLALRHLLVSEVGDTHQVVTLRRGGDLETPVFGRVRLEAGS